MQLGSCPALEAGTGHTARRAAAGRRRPQPQVLHAASAVLRRPSAAARGCGSCLAAGVRPAVGVACVILVARLSARSQPCSLPPRGHAGPMAAPYKRGDRP